LAVANLANTNKELKAISDVEYRLWGSSFSMVNGTLMAKGGQDQVNESVALQALAGAITRMPGRKPPMYWDFAALGPKPGEFVLHADFARGTTANQRYLGDQRRAGFTSMPGMASRWGREAVTAKR
jgi:hypothetical protein